MIKQTITGLTIILLSYFSVQAQAFKSGEKISYNISLGPIVIGKAEMIIDEITVKNRKVYKSAMAFGTINSAEVLFKIEDIYESYFDAQTFLPLKAIRNINEESYHSYNEVLFYRTRSEVKSKKSGIHKVPNNIKDLISTLYYARSKKLSSLKPDEELTFQMYFSDKVQTFSIKYIGIKKINTIFGETECLIFNPLIKSNKIISSEEINVYITNDFKKVPVRIELKLPAGSVKIELSEYNTGT